MESFGQQAAGRLTQIAGKPVAEGDGDERQQGGQQSEADFADQITVDDGHR
jgi:hypothetical protein